MTRVLHVFGDPNRANWAARGFFNSNPGTILNSARREVRTALGHTHKFVAITNHQDLVYLSGLQFDSIVPDLDWAPDEYTLNWLKSRVRTPHVDQM